MYDPSNHPTEECGNFLADLPRYLGLAEPAFEKEEIYPHVKACDRCLSNFRTAREMAAAFHGMKAQFGNSSSKNPSSITVERAVTRALFETRMELADVFYELGKAYLLEGIEEKEWIVAYNKMPKDASSSVKVGVSIANDGVLLSQGKSEEDKWKLWREELAKARKSKDPKKLLYESFRYFTVTRQINPKHEKAMVGIGLFENARGDHSAAIRTNEIILKETCSSQREWEAYVNTSMSYGEMGKYSEARMHAETSYRMNPEDPVALNNYFLYSLETGDRKDAYAIGEKIEVDDVCSGNTRNRLKSLSSGPLSISLREDRSFRNDLARRFPRTFTPDVLAIYGEGGAR